MGLWTNRLAALGRRRRIVLTVNQFFTAGQVVIDSDLLTVLPQSFLSATGYQRDLVVRELPFEIATGAGGDDLAPAPGCRTGASLVARADRGRPPDHAWTCTLAA